MLEYLPYSPSLSACDLLRHRSAEEYTARHTDSRRTDQALCVPPENYSQCCEACMSQYGDLELDHVVNVNYIRNLNRGLLVYDDM
jgi:hypothetical protein